MLTVNRCEIPIAGKKNYARHKRPKDEKETTLPNNIPGLFFSAHGRFGRPDIPEKHHSRTDRQMSNDLYPSQYLMDSPEHKGMRYEVRNAFFVVRVLEGFLHRGTACSEHRARRKVRQLCHTVNTIFRKLNADWPRSRSVFSLHYCVQVICFH